LLIPIAVISLLSDAQTPPPRLTIVESPPSKLRLEPYASAQAARSASFQNTATGEMQPLSLVLTNFSAKTIMGLTIRWTVTDRAGKQQILDYRTDSFFVARRPVLAPNARLLIQPGALIPEGAGITTAANPSFLEKIRDSASVGVYLDAVIFEDGKIVGPDRSETLAYIQARRTATEYVTRAVAEKLRHSSDPSPLLAELANARPVHTDYVGIWKVRVAQRLMHARDVAKELDALSNIPLLPELSR
jgi:hypothetical protein